MTSALHTSVWERSKVTGGAMARNRPTTGINRADLARRSLEQIRLWPGCETVVSVAVLAGPSNRFELRVIDYGAAEEKRADRALRFIEREKHRQYHLQSEDLKSVRS
jgi:hypothetical protein